MANQSDFLKTMVKTSQSRGSFASFDPLKAVGDTFNSVLGTAGGAIGGGLQGAANSIGDFSSMAQANIGAAQRGLQGLIAPAPAPKRTFRPPSNFAGSSAFTVPTPAKRKRAKGKKASY